MIIIISLEASEGAKGRTRLSGRQAVTGNKVSGAVVALVVPRGDIHNIKTLIQLPTRSCFYAARN